MGNGKLFWAEGTTSVLIFIPHRLRTVQVGEVGVGKKKAEEVDDQQQQYDRPDQRLQGNCNGEHQQPFGPIAHELRGTYQTRKTNCLPESINASVVANRRPASLKALSATANLK